MVTSATPMTRAADPAANGALPLLEQGDWLSRDEFERRYELMPGVRKAELVEGIVYMPSPVRVEHHSRPHSLLNFWLGMYAFETPRVECLSTPSVRLDLDNEPQPDLVLYKLPEKGGQTRISADDYLEGPPELVAEIVGSSRAYDLHQKKGAYRRNGVREYIAWITGEPRLIWWELHEGEYREIVLPADGVLKSVAFPGLWLHVQALLENDKKTLMATLRQGLDSPEHQAFLSGQ